MSTCASSPSSRLRSLSPHPRGSATLSGSHSAALICIDADGRVIPRRSSTAVRDAARRTCSGKKKKKAYNKQVVMVSDLSLICKLLRQISSGAAGVVAKSALR